MLGWKDEYSIGINVIDEQHKPLFEIGNEIYYLLESSVILDKFSKCIDILAELTSYTKCHFNYEEQYMQDLNFPCLALQKKQHEGFIDKLEAVDLNQLDNDQAKEIRNILTFIFGWILDHIMKSDLQLKHYVMGSPLV